MALDSAATSQTTPQAGAENSAVPVTPTFSIPERIDTLDQVPTQLRDQYRQLANGTFEFMHVAGLKKTVEATRKEVSEARHLASQRKQMLQSIVGDDVDIDSLSPEELVATIQSKASGQKKVGLDAPPGEESNTQAVVKQALGEAEKKFTQHKTRLETQNSALVAENAKLRSSLQAQALQSAIDSVMAGAEPTKTGLATLPLILKEHLVVLPNDDSATSYSVAVKADAGMGMDYRLNAMGQRMTVQELVDNQIKSQYPDLFVAQTAAPGLGHLLGQFGKTSHDGTLRVGTKDMDAATYRKIREQAKAGVSVVLTD